MVVKTLRHENEKVGAVTYHDRYSAREKTSKRLVAANQNPRFAASACFASVVSALKNAGIGRQKVLSQSGN